MALSLLPCPNESRKSLFSRPVFSVKLHPMEKQPRERCMVCAKVAPLNGGICQTCGEKIRAQARGAQQDIRDRSDRTLQKHGVKPEK